MLLWVFDSEMEEGVVRFGDGAGSGLVKTGNN